MRTAKLGDRVRIEYSRLLQRGATQAASSAPKTCEFTVGGKEVLTGLSVGVIGMAPGDRKQLTIQPKEAFGTVQSKLIRQIPRERFPRHISLKVGRKLTAFAKSSGRRQQVRVVEIHPDSVTLDGNHPLAGQVIQLAVNLISLDATAKPSKRKSPPDIGGRG
jgi:FKBP-type peptidyl-prolyl cis-trans isomerase 2